MPGFFQAKREIGRRVKGECDMPANVKPAVRFKVAIVRPSDPTWIPTRWDDCPESVEVLDTVQAKSMSGAEGLVYLFNAKRLAESNAFPDSWAVIIQPGTRVCEGDTLHRRVPTFDLG